MEAYAVELSGKVWNYISDRWSDGLAGICSQPEGQQKDKLTSFLSDWAPSAQKQLEAPWTAADF
jgi:hypothetical protein